MLPITLFSAIVWAFVLVKSVSFFKIKVACREEDKTIVGGAGAISALAILAQIVVWTERPDGLIGSGYAPSLFVALNLLAGVFAYTVVRQFTSNKERVCSLPRS